MKSKSFVMVLLTTVLLLCCSTVYASEEHKEENFEDIYSSQLEDSGANKLTESLPKDTLNSLNWIGIQDVDWKQLMNITPDKIFSQIISTAKESSPKPIKAALSVIAIILLAALMDSFKLSIAQRPLNGATGIIATLCVCTMALEPIIAFIERAGGVIKGASNFMLCYIPVMSGIMIASGQTVSAASYNILMMTSGEIISQIASGLLTPLLSIFLAVSVVSSISPNLNLDGICSLFSSFIKWALGLTMTVFVSLLTIQSLVGNAADSTSMKAAKFVISSFVPIVGSALGDAFGTVQSCIKLLKSGVGAFGIIAASFIFLPILIECLIWMFAMNLCSSISDIFQLGKISSLLKNAGKVVSTMLSIILSCMMILTVSTVIVLIVGGNVL